MFTAAAIGTCTVTFERLTFTRPFCVVVPVGAPTVTALASVLASAVQGCVAPVSTRFARTAMLTSQTLAATPIGTCTVMFSRLRFTSPFWVVWAPAVEAPTRQETAATNAAMVRRIFMWGNPPRLLADLLGTLRLLGLYGFKRLFRDGVTWGAEEAPPRL
jgi:hypothetical protein